MHRLLAVFPHPDDEVFSAGGLLAAAAEAGVAVRLVCATRGESGKMMAPELVGTEDVAAIRTGELEAACRALGIPPPVWLGYHDSGRGERVKRNDPQALINVPDDELERAVAEQLVDFRPDVVVTFDPHGLYGHPDHIAIHRATTAAFWSVGGRMERPPQRLFQAVLPISHLQAMQRDMGDGTALSELDPLRYAVSESSLGADLDVSRWRDRKWAAISAHRSQTGPDSSFARLSDNVWTLLLTRETFTLGGLRGAIPPLPLRDLMAGL